MLTKAGFEVRGARTLAAFEHELRRWRPDVALADVNVPGTEPETLCRSLQRGANAVRLPLVLFSHLRSPQLEALAARCGADAYAPKSAGFDILPAIVSSLCEEILW
ncbi:response regulator receiver protein [Haliangium ochraceum DSM 14365]|uniref:Response regulator receiver protein n=1 Tax=Haliangium ochraceum (strain DSM 14365 / JCM 11303 / SMP-2) TaxID=502025 RepID=D0LUC1_HALO1|nr:response regulator receiver protein [Haliangium ochraceum DSM 14365]